MENFDFNSDPFFVSLGMHLVSAENDTALIRLSHNDQSLSGIGGSVHGGVLATLLDNTGVAAVCSNLQGAAPAGTVDLQITYLRQSHGELEASARVVKRGRRLCTVLVDITDSQGRLCATGRVLYAVK